MVGKSNLFDDIEDHMPIRCEIETGTDRFFLAIKQNYSYPAEFFKKQHLVINSFSRLIKSACTREGISVSVIKPSVTTHGLCGTFSSSLLASCHADSSVSFHTFHRTMKSLRHYQNLNGVAGNQQQRDILAGRSPYVPHSSAQAVQHEDFIPGEACKLFKSGIKDAAHSNSVGRSTMGATYMEIPSNGDRKCNTRSDRWCGQDW